MCKAVEGGDGVSRAVSNADVGLEAKFVADNNRREYGRDGEQREQNVVQRARVEQRRTQRVLPEGAERCRTLGMEEGQLPVESRNKPAFVLVHRDVVEGRYDDAVEPELEGYNKYSKG